MKAFVDKDTCIGCEVCVGIYPEVFSMDDDGKSIAIKEDISSQYIESAQEAKDSCPVGAISID